MKKNKESEGEDLIADFLEEEGIKFKRPYKITDLKDDNKSFREADFYLPEYNIYIEFLGRWDNLDDIKRYKQKMAVYHKNKRPCIYLWPNNLGTLDWMFRRRLRGELLKYNRLFTLIKYELQNYTRENGILIIILGIAIYYLNNIWWRISISVLLAWILYSTVTKYVKRLRKIKKSKWVSGVDYKNNSDQKS